jgi:formylglycine-generating enzyme required for sulfatase activity
VIPILLDGAWMPKPAQVPKDLEELTVRNGLDIRHASFHADMDKLVQGLKAQTLARPAVRTPAAISQNEGVRRIFIDAAIIHNANGKWFLPGAGRAEWFKDHETGPEMIVVPAGSFNMGSPVDEPDREGLKAGTESPLHQVTIAQPFAVARHAISRGQFAAFVSATGHKTEGGAAIRQGDRWVHDPKASWCAPGFFQDDSHPVVCINWNDAKAYTAWFAQITGKPCRLLSEAEREYVTRAGTMTPFWWGSSITPDQANYDGRFSYQGGEAKVSGGDLQCQSADLKPIHGASTTWTATSGTGATTSGMTTTAARL